MKIPFEQTIAGAYRFAFTNILSVFGIGWFPFLLFGAGATAAVISVLPLFSGLIREGTYEIDTARLGAVIAPIIGTYVLILCGLIFTQAMVNVGMMRKALGQHPAPVFIFFSLGRQVWQLIGSYLLLLLLAWGTIALAAGAIIAISLVLAKFAPSAVQVLVTVLLVIAAYVWAVYAIVRVSFFIPAVVVAENHISLRRAWHLGKGNFWRIIGVMIIVAVLPSMALSTILQFIIQSIAGPPVVLTQNPTPAEAMAVFERMMSAFVKAGPYIAGLEFVYVIVASGLLAGAVAAAYNGVTSGEASAKASA